MLDLVLWIVFGWLLGVAVAAALGVLGKRQLAWNGMLGIAVSCLAGALFPPIMGMSSSGGVFSLAALAVAAVSCILLVLLGNLAAKLARRMNRHGWTA